MLRLTLGCFLEKEMSWLSSACQGRERCGHRQRHRNCCLDRRDDGQKGIWQGNGNAGEGDETAALLGKREKTGKALVPLSGLVLQCRTGTGSLCGTLQETQ